MEVHINAMESKIDLMLIKYKFSQVNRTCTGMGSMESVKHNCVIYIENAHENNLSM